MIERKVLAMCSTCKNIRVSDKVDIWLAEKDNPVLYQKFIEKYKEKLTHTYCPPCFEDAKKEIKNLIK